jgi:hypothetical protein
MQYLVTKDFVAPSPFLPIEQYAGMMRQAILPGHEALQTLKSEGKILAGGPVGQRAIAFIVKTKVTPLQDFEDRHDQDRQATDQMEQRRQQ